MNHATTQLAVLRAHKAPARTGHQTASSHQGIQRLTEIALVNLTDITEDVRTANSLLRLTGHHLQNGRGKLPRLLTSLAHS